VPTKSSSFSGGIKEKKKEQRVMDESWNPLQFTSQGSKGRRRKIACTCFARSGKRGRASHQQGLGGKKRTCRFCALTSLRRGEGYGLPRVFSPWLHTLSRGGEKGRTPPIFTLGAASSLPKIILLKEKRKKGLKMISSANLLDKPGEKEKREGKELPTTAF